MQGWEQSGYTVTKANCKNKISGQISKRWKELGGVKLSSSQPIWEAAVTDI